jgi:hypothetical protein
MATMGKYVVAYELAIKTVSKLHTHSTQNHVADNQDWWNKSKVQGPVIEQATHICKYPRVAGPHATDNQAICPDTSVVISTLTLSRKLNSTTFKCQADAQCPRCRGTREARCLEQEEL